MEHTCAQIQEVVKGSGFQCQLLVRITWVAFKTCDTWVFPERFGGNRSGEGPGSFAMIPGGSDG